MASHPTLLYFLCSQRPESLATSLYDLAALSFLLIPSTSSRISSNQTPLPPFLASISHALISPITRSVGSQPSLPRGRPDLLQIPVRTPRSLGHPSSALPLVASSVLLVSISLVPLELPFFVGHLPAGVVEPESAAVP